ncbi:hypothetical protein BaRGS_00033746, partial [Batillaria attramentaria]
VSAPDEQPQPRNIRLGSFIPMGSQTSDTFSDAARDNFVGVGHCRFKVPKWFRKFRFPGTMEPHSKLYVAWLFVVMLAFVYNATVIPLRAVFPYQTPANTVYWLSIDYLCDFIYIIDMTDFHKTRKHYFRKWMFKFDMLSLFPFDLLYLVPSVGISGRSVWLRLPRIFKIQTFWEFYERCDQAAKSSAHAIRIIKTMTYMLYLIHIETCGYYAMSDYEGIGSNRWVFNGKGNAYIRCFYLATKTATSIGNNPKPTNTLEYLFMCAYWLSGVFVFALLIGQIRDIVEAAGQVKDSYRKKMDAALSYMQSINIPNDIRDRARRWFLYNWEQSKTIDERCLVAALPKKLQTDLAISVHFNTLSKVQLFQDCERNLLYDLVLKLKPNLFLPGDYICRKGEVGKEMYIVSQGNVEVVGGENNEVVLARLSEGSVFGEISLLAMSGRGNRRTADVRCAGYTNVFTLSKTDFEEAMTEYPEAQKLLKKRAKKLDAQTGQDGHTGLEPGVHGRSAARFLQTDLVLPVSGRQPPPSSGPCPQERHTGTEKHGLRYQRRAGDTHKICVAGVLLLLLPMALNAKPPEPPEDDLDKDDMDTEEEEDELLVVERIEQDLPDLPDLPQDRDVRDEPFNVPNDVDQNDNSDVFQNCEDILNDTDLDFGDGANVKVAEGHDGSDLAKVASEGNVPETTQESADEGEVTETAVGAEGVKEGEEGTEKSRNRSRHGSLRKQVEEGEAINTSVESQDSVAVAAAAGERDTCGCHGSMEKCEAHAILSAKASSGSDVSQDDIPIPLPVPGRVRKVSTVSLPQLPTEGGGRTSSASDHSLVHRSSDSRVVMHSNDHAGEAGVVVPLMTPVETSVDLEKRLERLGNFSQLNGDSSRKSSNESQCMIPPENQITCAVEIHREKTKTPTAMLSMTEQPATGTAGSTPRTSPSPSRVQLPYECGSMRETIV